LRSDLSSGLPQTYGRSILDSKYGTHLIRNCCDDIRQSIRTATVENSVDGVQPPRKAAIREM
jgi:hypothetical protein